MQDDFNELEYQARKAYWSERFTKFTPRNDSLEEWDAFQNALEDRLNEIFD